MKRFFAMPVDPIPITAVHEEYPIITRRMARRFREQHMIPVWVVGHRAYVSRRDIEDYITERYRPARTAA